MVQCIIRWNHSTPEAAHPGISGTSQRILVKYYWPGVRQDVGKFIAGCVDCRKFKSLNTAGAQDHVSPRIPEHFETLSVDLVGPLPETPRGNNYIFSVMDIATGFLELFPLPTASAEAITRILSEDVFLRYGFPKSLRCDNGMQFVSAVMKQVAASMQIHFQYVATWLPRVNPVERKHRDLKPKLAIAVQDLHTEWDIHLTAIRWSMNSTPSSITGFSPIF